MDQITNTEKDKDKLKAGNKMDEGFFNNAKNLQQSITGSLTEHVCDFKERMEDEKEMMKWIRMHNLSRLQVFAKNTDHDKSSLFNSHRFQLHVSKSSSNNTG